MTNKMTFQVDGSVLTMERVFAAPRELVFEVYTTAEHLTQWWGPNGWEVTACTVDFRPGGVWHYCMTCKDRSQGDFFGMESWGKAVYREITPVESIVYTDYFSDAEGNITEGMPSSDIEMTFEMYGQQTKVITRATYASEEALRQVIEMGMEQGISETNDRLEQYLGTLQPSKRS